MPPWMISLIEQVSAWPSVSSGDHQFGAIEFRVGSREIGHVHSFGVVDIPFTSSVRDALIASGRAERHHYLPNSGWTTVSIQKHGSANALLLLRLSYLRAQSKISDPTTAAAARRELDAFAIEAPVLRAAS